MKHRPYRRNEVDLDNIDESAWGGLEVTEPGKWMRPPDRETWPWLGAFVCCGWIGQEMVRSSAELSLGGYAAGVTAILAAFATAALVTNREESRTHGPTEKDQRNEAAQSRNEPRSPRAP